MANVTPVQEMQYQYGGQQKLSEQDKYLIYALLADSGVYDMVASPSPGITPAPSPSPSPTPTQTPAPTPAASQAQAASAPVNVFLQLALTKVRAGDLITADFVNGLIDGLLALEARVRALEIGKATPATAAPTPTPTAPTPTPTSPTPSPSAEASLTGPGRSEPTGTEPTIEGVTGKIEAGKGVTITVTGDNLGKSVVERVLLGRTSIDLAKLKFARTGFSFLTTAAVVEKSGNRLTVTTSGGEDSAGFTASSGKKAPVL
jgi:pyruvate/2-oxoglutarate dehydrogenase complex dihydrolipoamide acyltransferase (E2) component